MSWGKGLLLFGLALACPMREARATDLSVVVMDAQGRALPDAVVTVVPHGKADQPPSPRQLRAASTKVIDQKALTFIPYIETFRPGDSVVFRNSDATRHHVYSFAAAKRFEFVLGPGESAAPQKLEKSGVIAAGCNIHDQMITYLYVTDAPWLARPDANGRAQLRGLPSGDYDVRVWHPRLKPGKPDLVQSTMLAVAGTQSLTFTLSLLPDLRRQFDREHTQY